MPGKSCTSLIVCQYSLGPKPGMSPWPDEAATEAANSIGSRFQDADLVPAGVKVLVVDGDSTTLAITSRMLLMFGYEVLTAKSTGNALSIIQERQDDLDLILTELHLPDADKLEVIEKLGRASNLPVIIMTADNNEGTMLGALLHGASLYLLKPISKFDIRDLWQFSFMRKRDQMAQVTGNSTDQDSSEEEGGDEPESQLPVIGDKQGEAMPRNQEFKEVDGDKEGDDADSRLPTKTKLTWTNELHEKFVRAIQVIGIDRAQPKKILEHMNVPGLRKQSISSHLQKYRLTVKRDQDTILKMLNPESRRLSSTMHLQGLLSFSELRLRAPVTTQDSHLPSFFQPNPDISPAMVYDRNREPRNYSNQPLNPIASPLFMPSDQLSRSSFRPGTELKGKEVVDAANVQSSGNDSCSIAETQSSRTGDPTSNERRRYRRRRSSRDVMFGAAKEDDRLSFQEEVGDTCR